MTTVCTRPVMSSSYKIASFLMPHGCSAPARRAETALVLGPRVSLPRAMAPAGGRTTGCWLLIVKDDANAGIGAAGRAVRLVVAGG